jgi:ribonuclease Y
LSGFNPVRREVARLVPHAADSDGRIHPARIEDVVKRVEKEVDDVIKEAGEQAAFDLGIHGMNNKLVRHLGKLKFSTSYAQNVLQHSYRSGIPLRDHGRRTRAEPEAGQTDGLAA